MLIIESVRNFIKKCPKIKTFDDAVSVNINYLNEKLDTYSIEEVPVNPIVKRYIGGSTLRQKVFVFCSRNSYGEDVFTNINNSGFYEEFAEWIEKMNNNGELPVLGDNKESQKIEVITNGYAFATEVDKVRYQIEFRLTYLQED
ncbi:hypothetical protein SNUCP2_03850 [Clostridium perfringens A]|uniref:chloramphenicol resistance protein n=1 Tax=Clostridium perfringens TaxID=1502 RepID=UPI00399CF0CF